MSRLTRFLVASLMVGSVACAPQAPPAPAGLTDADTAAIRAAGEAATAAMNGGDNAGSVRLYYASDAIVMPPNGPAVQGADAIITLFNSFPPISNAKFNIVEIEGAGDSAWARGTYTLTVSPPGAPAINDTGKYLEVWKKQADGSWKVHRDIYNSDMPLPAPAGGGH